MPRFWNQLKARLCGAACSCSPGLSCAGQRSILAHHTVRLSSLSPGYTEPPRPRPVQTLARRLFPAGLGPLSAVPRTGPAPIMARVSEWLRVIPRWEGISQQVRALSIWGAVVRLQQRLRLRMRMHAAHAKRTEERNASAPAGWPLLHTLTCTLPSRLPSLLSR